MVAIPGNKQRKPNRRARGPHAPPAIRQSGSPAAAHAETAAGEFTVTRFLGIASPTAATAAARHHGHGHARRSNRFEQREAPEPVGRITYRNRPFAPGMVPLATACAGTAQCRPTVGTHHGNAGSSHHPNNLPLLDSSGLQARPLQPQRLAIMGTATPVVPIDLNSARRRNQ
ncbi:unnamed protein product [Stenotrophomonas maltophilia]|nr:unnamed protein product [Stenotrophomonas maltophilia]